MKYLSFIDPERGGFGEIFPEVMTFPEGFSPREISLLKEIFRRIPRAERLEMIYYAEKSRHMFVQTCKVFLCRCNVNNATEDIICKFCYSFSVSGQIFL